MAEFYRRRRFGAHPCDTIQTFDLITPLKIPFRILLETSCEFAQQTNTPDPQLREELLALTRKFDVAYNNGDAAALAALYTEDAIEVTDQGPIYGRKAIEKHFADVFQKVHFSNHLLTLDQDSPHIIGTTGNEMWETGAWSQTIQGQNFGPIQLKGYHSSIAVREGGIWKKRLVTWNITPAPAAPAQTK